MADPESTALKVMCLDTLPDTADNDIPRPMMKVGTAKYNEIKDGDECFLLPVMRQRSQTRKGKSAGLAT